MAKQPKGYLYKITNNINGRWYIGSHVGSKTNYMGSGILLHRAYKKYGQENFTKIILKYTDDFQQEEEKLLTELDAANDPKSYNLNNSGTGGQLGVERSEETKAKISKANKGNQFWLGKKHSEETLKKMQKQSGENHPMWGKEHTKEHKLNLSNALSGRKISKEHRRKIAERNTGKKHSEETKKLLSILNSGENHPNFGKILSDETKAKISKANKGNQFWLGKKHSEETLKKMQKQSGENHPMWGKKHTDVAKEKISDAQRGEKNHNYGKSLPSITREKISQSLTGRTFTQETIVCPHCGKEGGKSAMRRYHFDNCNFKRKNKRPR